MLAKDLALSASERRFSNPVLVAARIFGDCILTVPLMLTVDIRDGLGKLAPGTGTDDTGGTGGTGGGDLPGSFLGDLGFFFFPVILGLIRRP